MTDYSRQYRRKHLQNQIDVAERLKDSMSRIGDKIANLVNDPQAKFVKSFDFRSNPHLNKTLSAITAEFQGEVLRITEGAVTKSWGISNQKNDVTVNTYFEGLEGLRKKSADYLNTNTGALRAFINRKSDSKTLSDLIWQSAESFRDEMEVHLGYGIANGDSAAKISQRMREYLAQPENLFRRVRNEAGKLELSANAKQFHPGQGVYRSSYKNAMRVARSETNQAYLTSDHLRWKEMDFVTGVNIELSEQHPTADICDSMQGDYPKDYNFTGWHSQCLCHATPILMPRDKFKKYLAGEEVEVEEVVDVPQGHKNWIEANKKRVEGWKSKPYFIRDNFKNGDISKGLSFKAPKVTKKLIDPIPVPKPEPVKFVPAKSTIEATEWARKNLNVEFVDFKGLDLSVINDINKSVFNIKNIMPEIKTKGIGNAQLANKKMKSEIISEFKKTDFYQKAVANYSQAAADKYATQFANSQVSNVGSNVVAWSTSRDVVRLPGGTMLDVSKYKGVFVNVKYGQKASIINDVVISSEKSGFYTKGAKDFGYIMSHEIGHEIDKTIGFSKSNAFKAIYEREHSQGIKHVIENLSTYGATAGGKASAKPFEFIAESWAEFVTSPSPRRIAKEVGEAMLKEYHEFYVKGTGLKYDDWKNEILKTLSK